MKKLFLLFMLLSHCSLVMAIDKIIGQDDSAELNCTTPAEYTNGRVIDADDILVISWHTSQTSGGPYTPMPNTPDICQPHVIDLTSYAEGQYYFISRAHSTKYNSVSIDSNEAEVNRILPLVPNAPVSSVR